MAPWLRWLLSKFMTLTATSDVGLVASFLDECVKLGMSIVALDNTPQVIAARQQEAEQKQRDLDAQAVTDAKSGDLTELRERSS